MRSGCQALLERAAPDVIYNDLSACNSYEAGDVAARIECPVSVMVGSEDKNDTAESHRPASSRFLGG